MGSDGIRLAITCTYCGSQLEQEFVRRQGADATDPYGSPYVAEIVVQPCENCSAPVGERNSDKKDPNAGKDGTEDLTDAAARAILSNWDGVRSVMGVRVYRCSDYDDCSDGCPLENIEYAPACNSGYNSDRPFFVDPFCWADEKPPVENSFEPVEDTADDQADLQDEIQGLNVQLADVSRELAEQKYARSVLADRYYMAEKALDKQADRNRELAIMNSNLTTALSMRQGEITTLKNKLMDQRIETKNLKSLFNTTVLSILAHVEQKLFSALEVSHHAADCNCFRCRSIKEFHKEVAVDVERMHEVCE